MKAIKQHWKDALIMVITLAAAFLLNLLVLAFSASPTLVPMLFVLGVFIVSLKTQGYFWGILASLISVLAVNYAFTFPFYAIDLITPESLASAVIMLIVSLMTSSLTTKVKLQEKLKAESEKERMRANLLRAVSHDLRTPLTTIYGSSTTLLENADAMTSEQKTKITEGIKEDSQWLIRMVENLLSITRIDSGNVKLIKTPTVLEELIDSVVLKFKKRYPGQKVEIEIPAEMVIIPMDAILIEQVIGNILENAVQHAKTMTRLVLRVFTIGEQAIFEIKDDGCGIDPKRLDTIFNGYGSQEYETADSQRKNAGIGLSVCATIIRAHGGSITAENAKAGGAVFRFTLDTEKVSNDTE